MALLIELHYSKDEILEAYLNEVNLGQNGNYSINGYGLASQFISVYHYVSLMLHNKLI